MTIYEKAKKAKESIRAIEKALKHVEEIAVRETRSVIQLYCHELEQTWDRFFAVHDKTIKVTPMILLEKSTTIGNIIPEEMKEKTRSAMKDVLKVMTPLVNEFEDFLSDPCLRKWKSPCKY